MIEDYTPIKIEEFKGLFDRGEPDNIPTNHAIEARNVVFLPNGFKTRPGSAQFWASSGLNILRFHVVKLNTADRFLVLLSNNSIVDSFTGSTILTITGMIDFSCITMFNRVYITPHDGNAGLAGERVQVYTGTGTARPIGLAQVPGQGGSPLSAADSGNAGSINAGLHRFAIVYETDTGYLSQPGPWYTGVTAPAEYTAAGDESVDIANIPIGGGTIVRKHIIATKAGLTEYFFIPGATIDDSITGVFDLDFSDDTLVDSADYLFDIHLYTKAGLGFARYAGRLVVFGFPSPDGSVLYVSNVGEPETFHVADGVVLVDKDNTRPVKSVVDSRGLLHIFKDLGVYSTADNGLEPVEWDAPISVDMGIGSTVYGVAKVLDETGQTTDTLLVADRSGLILFDGIFRRPALSWKIQDLWDSVLVTNRKMIQVAHDPIVQRIYVTIPANIVNTADYTSPAPIILVGDYTEGLDPTNIKWSIWDITNMYFQSVGLSDISEGQYTLKFAFLNKVYKFDKLLTTDPSVPIITRYQTGLLAPDGHMGGVNYFGPLRIRGFGNGTLGSALIGENVSIGPNYSNTALEAAPGREYFERVNFQNEKASVILYLGAGAMEIYKILLFARPLWPVRPSI